MIHHFFVYSHFIKQIIPDYIRPAPYFYSHLTGHIPCSAAPLYHISVISTSFLLYMYMIHGLTHVANSVESRTAWPLAAREGRYLIITPHVDFQYDFNHQIRKFSSLDCLRNLALLCPPYPAPFALLRSPPLFPTFTLAVTHPRPPLPASSAHKNQPRDPKLATLPSRPPRKPSPPMCRYSHNVP